MTTAKALGTDIVGRDLQAIVSGLMCPTLRGTHASYLPQVTPPNMICLHLGYPDPATFPVQGIVEATRAALTAEGPAPLQYCEEPGDPGLRTTIAGWHTARGRAIDAGSVIITHGTTDALELVLKLLVEPGDVVLMESPTYLWAIRVLKYAGARMVGISMDHQGIDPDALTRALEETQARSDRVKFLYSIPDFQNPSGICMSVERRKQVVDIAAQFGILVIEDNPYFDLRYSGPHRPTLFDVDDTGVVLSARTFSKTIGPGIRLGWVAGHKEAIRALVRTKQTGSCTVTSRIVDWFIRSGDYDRTVERTTSMYRVKHDVMQDALVRFCPSEVCWHQPSGGFYFWLTIPERVDVDRLFEQCCDQGVLFLKGRDFFCDQTRHNALRLSLSYESPERIATGVKTLCQILRRNLQ